MYVIYPSNYLAATEANALLDLFFTRNPTLRLFTNNFQPTPGTNVAQFSEASFAGYARKNLASVFNAPVKVQDGAYSITSDPFSFLPAASSPTMVQGWYIQDINNWLFAAQFLTPEAVIDSVPIAFTIQLIIGSLTITCP